ncbi:MAG TPA: preprotein translocase subunit SecY [Terracidiphilus sp.]|nr:preprotein translocase subunit SecY [Terracidiphilus sp.]
MLEKFLNIFRIPDLRKRVAFTFAMLAVYRLGAWIPTPGVDTKRLSLLFNAQNSSALGLMDLFSGGMLRQMAIFALGIMPYITASIIFQLLAVVYEPLARIEKEGELGRRKITQWTRYLTVLLGVLQSIGIAAILTKQGLVLHPGIGFSLMTVLTLTAGTTFVMWLGEQITDRGIGNGMSLLIFAGIVAGLPRGAEDLWQKVQTDAWGAFTPGAVVLLLIGMLAVVAFVVYVERAERRVPIQSARRIVGRRLMGGQASHLPLKVNSGGVMPIIFAQSILSAPMLLGTSSFVQNNRFLNSIYQALAPGMPWYIVLTVIGIIFFAYFYVSIVMRPDDIADNFRKSGSFIPGIRPGKRTSDFINDILTRITLVGAIYLVLVTLLPTWMLSGIRFDKIFLIGRLFENLPTWVTHGMGVTFYFGGTSLLIVVGVAMDTINQIESQLVMRHYDGFSPRSGRIRGRKTW